MKKFIITITLSIAINLMASAQSDGYFSDWSDYRSGEDPTAPVIPSAHGAEDNSSAPLGSGLLLLAGLGMAYGVKKKVLS